MVTSQNNQGTVTRPRAGKRIAGVALMLLGVALMAYGTHYLTMNGTCSSTGYASFGPVPTCRGNEFPYLASALFLGSAVIGVGWLMARVSGLLWPVFCIGMAVALITIRQETTAAAGAKSFGLVIGVFFVVLAMISVIVTVPKRLRPAHRADRQKAPTVNGPGPNPRDAIAKPAWLRHSAAITDEEFERQKAEILSQM
jgi:hypothetical protein